MRDLAALELTETADAVRFAVHARPRAKVSRIGGVREGALEVQVAAPPVDGAANDAIIATLADALGVPKRNVSLVHGDAGRAKLFEVHGVPIDAARARLAAAAAAGATKGRP